MVRSRERATERASERDGTYINPSVPHVVHGSGVVVGVGGHVFRHDGAHPVDQSLRRILALHASHRHHPGRFGSAAARGIGSRANLGDVCTKRRGCEAAVVDAASVSLRDAVVVCVCLLLLLDARRR